MNKLKNVRQKLALGLLFLCPLIACELARATPVVRSEEGMLGERDEGRRSPVVTYSTEVSADASSAKILADAYTINDEMKKYPIVFKFFINGRLFSEQIRSKELPNPIGIDVPRELAPLPFNYTIIASVQHPDQKYTTLIQGHLFADNVAPTSNLECTIDIPRGDETLSFEGQNESVTQTANNSFVLSFKGVEAESNREINVGAPLSVDSTGAATGTLTVTEGNDDPVSYAVSGTVKIEDTKVTAVDLSAPAAGGTLVVDCQELAIVDDDASADADDSGDTSEDELEAAL